MSFDSNRRTVLKGIGAGTAALVGGAGVASAGPPGDKTILELALELADGDNDPDFDVLVAAVVEAELTGLLGGKRQLTVLAPTDAAFNYLGISLDDEGGLVVEDPAAGMLKDASLTLRDVLTYHVLPGRRKAKSVTGSKKLPTLNGAKIDVDGVDLNGDQADIIDPDAANASNGIIHVINGVLLPPE